MENYEIIPPQDQTIFTLEGQTYSIELQYKKDLYKAHPHYTIEEIVGTYLGYNDLYPAYIKD